MDERTSGVGRVDEHAVEIQFGERRLESLQLLVRAWIVDPVGDREMRVDPFETQR